MELLPVERETIIHFDEASVKATVYTANKKVAERLIKHGIYPVREEENSWWFEIAKHSIRIKESNKSCYIAGRNSTPARQKV